MDFRQIQYFMALYEERSITKAAKRLHVVQPAVSMQIRKLEMDYGVKLFDRTAQGVRPNALAEHLYPLCQKVQGDLGAARRFLKEAKGKLTGSLSVGVPPSLAHGCLAEVIAEFTRQYPDVRLSIFEGYTGHLVEWLTDGQIEVAIIHGMDGDRRLQLSPLGTESLVAVMSKATTAGRKEITGAALQSLRLALPTGRNLTRLLMDSAFAKEGLSLEPAIELDSLAAVFNLVRVDGWASILPSAAVGGRQFAGELARIRLIEPSITRTLVVARIAGAEISHAAQLFTAHLGLVLKFDAARTESHQPP